MARRDTPGRPGRFLLPLVVLFGAAAALPGQEGRWIVNGPAGGTAYCLAASPDGATVYAGTDDGVFVGTRGGTFWRAANAGVEGARVQALAVDPENPAILYAGTLTPLGVPSIGIFQSTDGGATWTPINGDLVDPITGISPVDVSAIAVDPANSSTLIIGTRDSEIYKSTDGGASWLPKTLGLVQFGAVVTEILFDPTTAGHVYGASNLGFLASTDGGETWAVVGDAGIGFRALAADPTTAGVLYAGSPDGFGVFKSLNYGANWTAVNTNLPADTNGALPAVVSVALDPSNAQTVLIGTTSGAFLSTNGGGAWAPTGEGVVGPVVDSLVYTAGAAPGIVLGTHGAGVFRSDDGAASWARASTGLNASLVAGLLADPQTPGHLLAAVYDGVFASGDGAASWTNASSGLPFGAPVGDLARGSDGRVYAATLGGGLFASADEGQTWTARANGLSDPDLASVAVDPTDPLTVYAGTAHPYDGTNSERVFKSTDGGATWTQTSLDAQGAAIGLLVVDPGQPARVAAVSPGALAYFQTTDGGGSWSTIDPSATCGPVNAVLYDDANGAILVGGPTGLCTSTDGGTTWALSAVAALTAVDALFRDPADPTTLYAGTEPLVPGGTGGVFASDDGGATWTAVGTGLEAAAVHTVARDASGDRLYAGIFGGGVATLWLTQPPRNPIGSPATPPPAPRVIVR